MKVLFLIQGQEVAASRYRVLQYLPYLEGKRRGGRSYALSGNNRGALRFFP